MNTARAAQMVVAVEPRVELDSDILAAGRAVCDFMIPNTGVPNEPIFASIRVPLDRYCSWALWYRNAPTTVHGRSTDLVQYYEAIKSIL